MYHGNQALIEGANFFPKPCHKSWQGIEITSSEKALLMTTTATVPTVGFRDQKARTSGLLRVDIHVRVNIS